MLNNKTEKGLYAPSYYNEFKCIADRCRHSCCIDWEICIDEETYEKYKQTGDLLNTVKECEDGPCFVLREDGRCPHLNDRGLCNIILSHGEEYLSEICQNHPRFYNEINGGRTEAGLGIVCEEACRLILENETPFSLSKIEELDGEEPEGADFNALPQRAEIISVIEGEGRFDEKLLALKAAFELPSPYTPNEWLDRFLSLEILAPNWKSDLESMRGRLFLRNDRAFDPYETYYARLLTYFVYRHVSVAEREVDLCARLAFAILSVEVIRSLFEEAGAPGREALIDLARRYSAEIEYSEDNTAELIFAFESAIL